MKKVIILLGLIILLNVSIASATSEKCLEDFSNLKPAFSVIVRNDKPTINPGDSIKIEVYITGYGSVKKPGKIYVMLPMNFVDENEVFGNFTFLTGFNGHTFTDFQINPYEKNTSLFGMIVPEYFFQQYKRESLENCFYSGIVADGKYEIKGTFFPPILFSITTSKKADNGDHNLKFVLSYSDGTGWYQSEETVEIHIRDWYEKIEYQIILVMLPIIAGIIGFGYRKRKKLKEKIGSLLHRISVRYLIFGFITAFILWFFRVPSLNAYILDILSPIFILIGTVLMALYPINVSYFERNTRFMEKLTFIKGHDGPFKDFERQNIIVGICLISLGIVIQIYANWIQSH